MMIHKITPSVYYNPWLNRLDVQLNETTTYKNSFKVPKFGTSVINNPMSPFPCQPWVILNIQKNKDDSSHIKVSEN